jgi:hypothetical protein
MGALKMGFSLDDYEDVATLNKWFIENYPMGRSDISVISHDPKEGYILIQATLWRDSKDDKPAVSNIAFGSRETYMPNMKKWYCEDTASSSLGRAIIILKGSNKTATKDSMKVVQADQKQNEYEKKLEQRRYGAPNTKSAAVEDALRASFAVENKVDDPQQWSLDEAVDAIGKSTPNPPPECEHGMILKQGVSKGGKPYYGYVCKGSNKDHAIWAKMTANGNWFFQGGE